MSLTTNSRVAIRRNENDAWVDVSDLGTGGWNTSDTFTSRVVPSLERSTFTQLLNYKSGSASFTIDDNETTHPLLFMRSGDPLQVRVREAGDGALNPERVFEGIATINLLNAAGGVRSFQVSLAATSVTDDVQ